MIDFSKIKKQKSLLFVFLNTQILYVQLDILLHKTVDAGSVARKLTVAGLIYEFHQFHFRTRSSVQYKRVNKKDVFSYAWHGRPIDVHFGFGFCCRCWPCEPSNITRINARPRVLCTLINKSGKPVRNPPVPDKSPGKKNVLYTFDFLSYSFFNFRFFQKS